MLKNDKIMEKVVENWEKFVNKELENLISDVSSPTESNKRNGHL